VTKKLLNLAEGTD